ncbi:hypothetical protein DJ564_17870 [Pseudomonas sp. 31-12]|nr:hypothetical protein DJ564_17870 [Pseudomonas sp. 31-12]
MFDTLIKDFFLELLNFLISIQSEVGFFYLGLENVTSCEVVDQQSPGSKLIRRFSFQKVEQHWTIPMVALKQRIEEEMASSNCPMDSSNEA